MKINMAENIRACRKERRLTQEQLAEALGVTVGAVSKWESGATVPELPLIVELASFFETSVDVLLGYEWRGGNIAETVANIKSLRNEKRFDEASAVAERALLKYPNSFEIAFPCAVLYSMKGVERGDKRSLQRSLALFERALELISQNTNEQINGWTIRNNIAETYLLLGQNEKALETLCANNADGLNNGSIGYTLAVALKKPDEALPYLSDAMLKKGANLFRIVVAFADAYEQKRDCDSADAVLAWMQTVVEGLESPGVSSYFSKEAVLLLTARAQVEAARGRADSAKARLREAKTRAERFDAAPSYSFEGARFYHSTTGVTAFDDFGVTALDGIRKALSRDKDRPEQLLRLWAEVLAE